MGILPEIFIIIWKFFMIEITVKFLKYTYGTRPNFSSAKLPQKLQWGPFKRTVMYQINFGRNVACFHVPIIYYDQILSQKIFKI